MNASLENINYQIKMKETFGIDFTRGAQDAQFRSADDGAGLSLVAMIALMAKFSGSAAGRSFTSAVYNTTARVLPRGMALKKTGKIQGGQLCNHSVSVRLWGLSDQLPANGLLKNRSKDLVKF